MTTKLPEGVRVWITDCGNFQEVCEALKHADNDKGNGLAFTFDQLAERDKAAFDKACELIATEIRKGHTTKVYSQEILNFIEDIRK